MIAPKPNSPMAIAIGCQVAPVLVISSPATWPVGTVADGTGAGLVGVALGVFAGLVALGFGDVGAVGVTGAG